MKKENNSKCESYLQKLNSNQSNSTKKNPLKFLAFYVGRSKNRKQHVGGCKGKSNDTVAKAIKRSFYRKEIKRMLKAA